MIMIMIMMTNHLLNWNKFSLSSAVLKIDIPYAIGRGMNIAMARAQ